MFWGNSAISVLYFCTASLYLRRAMAMRFSVPSSSSCKSQEVLVGLDVGVVLHHHQQPRKRRVDLAVGRDLIGRRLRARHLRAGLGDRIDHGLLMAGHALHGLNQVRNQVGAALQHDVHLRHTRR